MDDPFSVPEPTVRTKTIGLAGAYLRTHLKEVAAITWAAVSTVALILIAYGHRQADSEMLGTKLDALTTQVQGMSVEIRRLSDKQIEMNGTMEAVDERTEDLKLWRDRVLGVAETYTVPKLAHRSRPKS